MIRRPPRSTQSRSSAASDVYKRQDTHCSTKFTSSSFLIFASHRTLNLEGSAFEPTGFLQTCHPLECDGSNTQTCPVRVRRGGFCEDNVLACPPHGVIGGCTPNVHAAHHGGIFGERAAFSHRSSF
eukprot:TRINITY_DN3936_c0_g1_i1.p2 TRINITY_DN3936_c0_g1~~TRINITY_DN3936_c0_g1_i1.p2  ORF type:complete len:126 (+),score=20.84 TRINITY_DN3936_c0_g1_i1:143-520(+)